MSNPADKDTTPKRYELSKFLVNKKKDITIAASKHKWFTLKNLDVLSSQPTATQRGISADD